MALLAASASKRAASASAASASAEASQTAPLTACKACRPLRLADICRSHASKTNSKEESTLCKLSSLSASFCIAGHARHGIVGPPSLCSCNGWSNRAIPLQDGVFLTVFSKVARAISAAKRLAVKMPKAVGSTGARADRVSFLFLGQPKPLEGWSGRPYRPATGLTQIKPCGRRLPAILHRAFGAQGASGFRPARANSESTSARAIASQVLCNALRGAWQRGPGCSFDGCAPGPQIEESKQSIHKAPM